MAKINSLYLVAFVLARTLARNFWIVFCAFARKWNKDIYIYVYSGAPIILMNSWTT